MALHRSSIHRLRLLAACLRRLMRLTANNWPWAPRLQQHPAILASMAHLAEGLSTPSQCRPLFAGLHSMTKSSTCAQREVRPPPAFVLNALTASPRRGAIQPNIRTIEASTALPDERPCLDYSYGENKKEGEQNYEKIMKNNTKKGANR